ncbi:MAG: prepilin-type N-terminal cleavage/methylation domain-containing protein [Oscillospiraceae bacterium]|nr:prepilin-type N-terminal cleavage/methylation domain-containing protein [Oscillospiraceae bacterium]
MKDLKKKVKGFTLVELIIVMALFSLVMFSVAQLLAPVTKFYVRSSNYESSTACIDNLKRAIEGNLKYADRVRVYSNFDPAANLDTHVDNFWDEFFKDRQFMDCKGTIYAMVFYNEVPNLTRSGTDWVISGYTNFKDFQSAKKNSGRIDLYQYTFDNTNRPSLSGATVTPWYVNQKLYGNYEYQFNLGAIDSVSTPGTFNPSDCTIGISSYEIRRDHNGGERLVISDIPQSDVASFSMKNVLDSADHYNTPLSDYKLVLDNPAATYDQNGDKKYVQDNTPIPRYRSLNVNPYDVSNLGSISTGGGQNLGNAGQSLPCFYFIFTLPDSVQDERDDNYIDAVNAAFP